MNHQFQKGFPEGFTPVYPIDRAQIREIARLKHEEGKDNGLVSLRVGKSHGTSCPAIFRSDQGLAQSLDEIMAVRKLVGDGEYAFEFMGKYWFDDFGPMPTHFPKALAEAHRVFAIAEPLSFDNPEGCAQIVRMDDPGDLHRIMKPWMLAQGFVYKGAERDSFDFVDIAAEGDKVASAAREAALEKAFDIKWFRGIARPEEVAGYNMTAYSEGAPGHCESYAGHAAFSESTAYHFATQWREVGPKGKLNRLSQETIKEIVYNGYSFAQWRAFAGMHYGPSNVEPFKEAHEYGYRR